MNRENELKHFGIKGMKWGVWTDETRARRLGSKIERYKRGKKYALEMQSKQNKEFNKLFNESSQKKKTLRKEAVKIANKYGLDYNDGSWDDDTKFSGKELQKARKEYLNKIEELESIDDRNKAESVRRAAKYVTDKYGGTAIKDISFFNVATAYMVAGGVTVGSAITLTAAALLLK